MPYFAAPRSDFKRLLFLQRAASTGAQDLAAGQAALCAETVADLAALAAEFGVAYHRLSVLLAQRMAAVAATQEAMAQLQLGLRDVWSALRRRVRRQGEPVSVLGLYQLPAEGRLPNPGARQAWIALAEAAIQGEAKAITAGFPALSNPGIEELQAALLPLQAGANAVANADRAYQQAQQAVAALRPRVDLCLKALMRELRWRLVAEDEPGFRRIARRYGAEYRPYVGEETQPEENVQAEAVQTAGDSWQSGQSERRWQRSLKELSRASPLNEFFDESIWPVLPNPRWPIAQPPKPT